MAVKTVFFKMYYWLIPKCLKNNISASDLFEEHIDFVQIYHDMSVEGSDVTIEFVSEMCEAFVMFDKVKISELNLQ